MNNSNKRSVNNSFQLLGIVLGLFMGILFISFGLGILLDWFEQEYMDTNMFKIFGGAMICYGLFRLFRVYLKYKEVYQNEG